jgi:hypothetical protein
MDYHAEHANKLYIKIKLHIIEMAETLDSIIIVNVLLVMKIQGLKKGQLIRKIDLIIRKQLRI